MKMQNDISAETYSDLIDELLSVLITYIEKNVVERGLVIEDIACELFGDTPGISDEGEAICVGRQGITRFFLVRDEEEQVFLEVVMRDDICVRSPVENLDALFEEFMTRK